MNTIVIATKNKNKVKEIKEILKNIPINIVSLDDINVDIDVVEDGDTFEQNACKKALNIAIATGKIALADDSGLEVDALNGEPGVHSARFSGIHGDDEQNKKKLLELMKDVPNERRGARFVTAAALVFPDGRKIVTMGEIRGFIGREPRGNSGFGYDPLFVVPEYNKTFAELGEDIKNSISHRGKALEMMKREIAGII